MKLNAKTILENKELKKIKKSIHTIMNELYEIKSDLIEQIIIEGVDDPGILKCVFMAGGPGSGKSFTAMSIFGVDNRPESKEKKAYKAAFAASGLKIVNSDPAFEKMLKDNGINPKELGNIEKEDPELWDKITGKDSIRNRAKEITNKQKAFYEEGRLGMIVDGTGDDYEKIKKQKQYAESLGYDCYMVFVNTTLKVALERNRKRERTLPDSLVQEIWKDVQSNLGRFQGLFGGNFSIVDNTTYGPSPALVVKAINQFLRKPIYNQIGKKWIETARALKRSKLIK